MMYYIRFQHGGTFLKLRKYPILIDSDLNYYEYETVYERTHDIFSAYQTTSLDDCRKTLLSVAEHFDGEIVDIIKLEKVDE